ncbi:transcriptional coactivator p15/PC4 family protein [Acidobacteriota bacterium]
MDVYEFNKNSVEKVKITLQEFKGHKLLDIRVYYEKDKNEFLPTKRGISLSLDLLSELLAGIKKVKGNIEGDIK